MNCTAVREVLASEDAEDFNEEELTEGHPGPFTADIINALAMLVSIYDETTI